MNAFAVLAALGSALFVALASVLQHRAGHSDSSSSLGRSLRHPLWALGAIAGLLGFGLHVLALSFGALSVIQPVLVSGLLFAVPISSVVDHRRIRLAEIGSALAVVGGLLVFQAAARPATGSATADPAALAWCTAVSAALLSVPLLWASRRPSQRDLALGLCAGGAFGVVASLLKSTVGSIAAHGLGVVSTWPLYAFTVLVALAIAANQVAFNSGPLARSLPLITIVDPLVAVVIGSIAFGETVATGLWSIMAEIVGFATMSVGVVVLSRSVEAPRDQPAEAPLPV